MAASEDHTEEYTRPTADCPAWCIGHLHKVAPAFVSCIALERSTDGTGSIQHYPASVELSLVCYQYRTGDDIWLYIGDGSRGLDITLESARRLMGVLARYVEDEGWGGLPVFPLAIGAPSAGNSLPSADAMAPCSCRTGSGT